VHWDLLRLDARRLGDLDAQHPIPERGHVLLELLVGSGSGRAVATTMVVLLSSGRARFQQTLQARSARPLRPLSSGQLRGSGGSSESESGEDAPD
jgi:hypothetical protein